jgi:hypothetical protein
VNKELLEYIRTNRTIYSRQALDNSLRAAGYPDAEIEAAWQQVLGEYGALSQQAGAPPSASWTRNDTMRFLGRLVLIVVLIAVGGIVLFLIVLGICVSQFSGFLSN